MAITPPAAEPLRFDGPPAVEPRGTVIVLPGRGEHPGVYVRFGRRISADAYVVRVLDEPLRVGTSAVVRQARELIAEPSLPRPVVLAGSDSGALFSVRIAGELESEFAALILAGLPTAEPVKASTQVWEQELELRTACSAHRGLLDQDQLVTRGALSAPLPKDWHRPAGFAELRLPVLGLHGQADQVSPLSSVRTLYARIPTARLWSLRDGRHDILNDRNHRSVAALVVLFLEQLRSQAPRHPILECEIDATEERVGSTAPAACSEHSAGPELQLTTEEQPR